MNTFGSASFSLEPAREMLDVLRSIEEGLPWKEKAQTLLRTKGYRYMMFTCRLSKRDMMTTLESLQEGVDLQYEKAGWLRNQLLGYRTRLQDLREFLEELEIKSDQIVSRASERAKRYLPSTAQIEADIYLVLGGSDAYGVNLLDTRAVVMNVGLFVSEMDELTAMMAHELHHKADSRSREIYWRLHGSGRKKLERVYSLFSELIGEGVATWATYPIGIAHKYSKIEKRIAEEYKIVENGLLETCEDVTDQRAEEIFNYLYSNSGPLYMVGCDMAKKIEETLGREALIASAQEPMSFFQTYHNAVDRLGEGYRFSKSTMTILREMQQEIDSM